MRVELTEVVWLDRGSELGLRELAAQSGLSESELRELVDYGVIAPTDATAEQPRFCAEMLLIAQTARRLRQDFELDAPALVLALTLLERIRSLEAEMQGLRARLPGFSG